jgi:ribosomal protein S18 acetylase RimI-like enzyme
MAPFSIERAQVDDARALARIKIAAWAKTYRGIVPDAILDRPDEDWQAQGFAQRLSGSFGRCFVARNGSGSVIGFAECGAARDDLEGFTGKLYSIYLHPDSQGQGVGRQLINAVITYLLAEGHRSMLWVIRDNHPACRFYERMGGQVVGERFEEIGGVQIPELAYGWHDLASLDR